MRNVARSRPRLCRNSRSSRDFPTPGSPRIPITCPVPSARALEPIVEHRHVAVPAHEPAQRAAAHLEAAALRPDQADVAVAVRAIAPPQLEAPLEVRERSRGTRRSCPRASRAISASSTSRASRRSPGIDLDDLAARRDEASRGWVAASRRDAPRVRLAGGRGGDVALEQRARGGREPGPAGGAITGFRALLMLGAGLILVAAALDGIGQLRARARTGSPRLWRDGGDGHRRPGRQRPRGADDAAYMRSRLVARSTT